MRHRSPEKVRRPPRLTRARDVTKPSRSVLHLGQESAEGVFLNSRRGVTRLMPLRINRTPIICIEERTMKKTKRTKAKSSSTRARRSKRTTRTKTATATKKSVLPKVKRVAKKAALAAGVAAIGTALSELQPEIKSGERDASHEDKSTRGKR
jgi:hypothetical protein